MSKKPVIEIVTPQFERGPKDPGPVLLTADEITDLAFRCVLSYDPAKREEMARLDPSAAELEPPTPGELRELGLRPWNDPDDFDPVWDKPIFRDHVLWLLPGEWFERLPPNLTLVDIFGKPCQAADADDDIRFGCLAYGFLLAKSIVE